MSRQKYLNDGGLEESIDDSLEIEFLKKDMQSLPALLSTLMADIKALKEQVSKSTSSSPTVPLTPSYMSGGGPLLSPSPGVTPPVSAAPTREFLDGVDGTVANLFKTASSNYADFIKDWTSTPLEVVASCGKETSLRQYSVKDDSHLEHKVTKTARSQVPTPSYGSKFKDAADYHEFVVSLVSYVRKGGSVSLLTTLGGSAGSFAMAMSLELHDLGVLSVKETVATILLATFRPLDYLETVGAFKKLNLKFYKYGTTVDTVSSYTLLVKKSLVGKPPEKSLAKVLLESWDDQFVKWKSYVLEKVSDESMDSWDQLFVHPEQQAVKSCQMFLDGVVLSPTPSKPSKPAKVGALSDGKPKEGLECVACGRKLTTATSPDLEVYQTHGYATSVDGSETLCQETTFKDKLSEWMVKRSKDHAAYKARVGKKT